MCVCVSVANRTVDQANIVGDAVVGGANEVSQATVEGVENVAASGGLIQVSRRRSFRRLHARLNARKNDSFTCLCLTCPVPGRRSLFMRCVWGGGVIGHACVLLRIDAALTPISNPTFITMSSAQLENIC